jgi:hypothetical protein
MDSLEFLRRRIPKAKITYQNFADLLLFFYINAIIRYEFTPP